MTTSNRNDRPQPERRALLRALAAGPALAIPLILSPSQSRAQTADDSALAAATMGLISTNICSVMPETTEGPYYIDPKLVRRVIEEDRPGIPLRMQLQIVTADCRPVSTARVDIWHCDAQGNYSGYASQGSDTGLDTRGQTFLRGTQFSDAQGVVTFETIYPGWYRGRTTHIHYKVFLNDRTVLTSQVFFPDALSEYVYEKSPVYRRADQRDTLNSIDSIAAQAGEGAYCAIREQQDRYSAALVIGIDPAAKWTERAQGMNGPPPQGPARLAGPPGLPADGQALPPFAQRQDTTRIFPGS